MRGGRLLTLWALLAVVLLPGVATVLIPFGFVSRGLGVVPPNLGALEITALGIGGAGLALLSTCVWMFLREGRGTLAPIDPPQRMVVTGPYRVVRNPMYLGVVMTVAAEAVLFRSLALAAYAAALLVAFHLFVILYEEPNLRRKFGRPYTDYAEAVPRWAPRLPFLRDERQSPSGS